VIESSTKLFTGEIMTDIKEGSIVKCAFCKKDVAVQFVSEYSGVNAYNLVCFHRNALCPTCGQMARDVSDKITEVQKHCATCDPAEEDD
jgi:peroxiredoxin